MSAHERIEGVLVSVNPTGGFFVIETDDGHHVDIRLLDRSYWAAGSSARAYRAALHLKTKVGRRIIANAERHSAFGLAVFGPSNIKTEHKAGRRRG